MGLGTQWGLLVLSLVVASLWSCPSLPAGKGERRGVYGGGGEESGEGKKEVQKGGREGGRLKERSQLLTL